MSEAGFKLKGISQVCIVVRDLDKMMESYWRTLGIGPWRVYTFGPETSTERSYRGRPANFHLKIGQAQIGPLSLELIQPLDGDTIHKEFLERVGEGVHHLGIRLQGFDEALEQMHAAGFQVIQSASGTGATSDGAHAYLDTESQLGVVYELSKPPSVWRADYWYPAPPAEA